MHRRFRRQAPRLGDPRRSRVAGRRRCHRRIDPAADVPPPPCGSLTARSSHASHRMPLLAMTIAPPAARVATTLIAAAGATARRSPAPDRRPGARARRDPDVAHRRRPRAARRRARSCENAHGALARRGGASRLPSHSVHAGSRAERHHRHRDSRGRFGDGRAQLSLRARSDLREHRPRRRDQSRAAAHAGRAARGDAGAQRDGERRHDAPPRAVLRARDAESDRAGRHVSAARSAARPLSVRHSRRLSAGRRRDRDSSQHDRRRGRSARARSSARRS